MLTERLKKTFLDLIKIESVYPNEDKVIKYVSSRLKSAKANFREDSFRNLIIKIPGSGEPVLFNTHIDIPEPTPNLGYLEEGNLIKSDGSGILGADPKSGLAILIELIVEILEQKPKSHLPVEIVLTRGEEVGLFGAINLDYSLLKSKMGIILDDDGPVTQAVIQAPAYVRVDATFSGKTAHPRDYKVGINALSAAAEAILAIPPGQSTEGVLWNIGFLNSGTARNSIPGQATLRGELRSHNTDLAVSEGERIKNTYEQICKKHQAGCQVDKKLEFEGFRLESTHRLLKKMNVVYKKMQLYPNYYTSFGGSDANIFNSHGIASVPIGAGYFNAHQYSEYVNLEDMVTIFFFLMKFIKN